MLSTAIRVCNSQHTKAGSVSISGQNLKYELFYFVFIWACFVSKGSLGAFYEAGENGLERTKLHIYIDNGSERRCFVQIV